LAELEDATPEAAVEQVNHGLGRMREAWEQTISDDDFEEDEMVARLIALRESLREQYEVGQTLNEQLQAAVAGEQYELAARLRDEIARRVQKKRA
jgi:protein-arginine kinase activator protein McsA